uniref:Uncharacterized protein n=1 Tax=Chrysemys picta bellii TaxID=8478 RepID=A0A8C3FN41_CHRPI
MLARDCHCVIDVLIPRAQVSCSCRMCSNRHSLQCFRQYAKDIGFIKLKS